MSVCHIDFETRSAVDLKQTGAYIYAMHESTDVWCMAYAFDEEEVQLWTPDLPCPPRLKAHIVLGETCVAHNAAFERIIFQYIMGPRYGWPVPDLEQWRCTMAMAYAMALPGSLEEAGAALGLSIQKDMTGRRRMLKMSRPRKISGGTSGFWDALKAGDIQKAGITWWDDDEHKEALYAYCKTDIEVERMLEKRMMALRPQEQEIWFLDQRINDRGVFIDKRLCDRALEVVEKTQTMLDREMKEVTAGAVDSCASVSALVKWLKLQGVETDSVNKEMLDEMLGAWELTPAARRALELRQEAAKTSTAKIKKMLDMRAEDGRMRGNLQYHGAGTGRWAARGAQLQNLPRPKIKEISEAIDTIMTTASPALIGMLYGPPLGVISDCIRGMIAAPEGKHIIAADLSNIEGRGVAWLAGEETKLNAFRAYDAKKGPDIYLVAAAGIFGCSIEEALAFRQIGKVSELSLGYQGGPAAFGKMSGNYGLKIGDHYDVIWNAALPMVRDRAIEGYEKRGKDSPMEERAWLASEVVKIGWRLANQEIVKLWYGLENAAVDAVRHPGQTFGYREVEYKVAGSFLWCRLPSGRVLCYPYPRMKQVDTSWGEKKEAIVYKTVDGITRKWGDKPFYGGLAAENITQAVARDVMAEAMLRIEAAGYPCILTVHDEIVSEVDENYGSVEEFVGLLVEQPTWAKGFPISAEGWRGTRYRK